MLGIGQNLDYINDNTLIVSRINSSLTSNPALSIGVILVTVVVAILFGAFLGSWWRILLRGFERIILG